MSCLIKVVVDKNMPAFSGPGYFSYRRTADKCVLCGTDHGFADALDSKLETLRKNLREIYGIEPVEREHD